MLEGSYQIFLQVIYGQIGADNYWQLAAEAFSDCVKGGVGQISAYGPDWGDVKLFEVPNFIDNARSETYQNQYANDDMRLPAVVNHTGKAFAADDFIDVEAFEKTSLVNEFLDAKDVNLRWCVAHMEAPSKDTVVLTSMMRSRDRGSFSKTEVDEIGLLTPHIHRAIQFHFDMNLAAINANRLEATLDAISDAIFVCDRHGRLVHVNETGAYCLDKSIYLSGRSGQLSAINCADREPLLSTIKRAALPFSDLESADLCVALRSADGSSVNLARVYPLPSYLGTHDKTSQGEVLVILKNVRTENQYAELALTALGLTPAEISLAVALIEGKTLSDHARARNVSLETVRSQVRSSMRKMGVSRQADLIRMVLQYAQ